MVSFSNMMTRKSGRMVGNGGGMLSEFGKYFLVDVGTGGMDCAHSYWILRTGSWTSNPA